MSWRQDPREVGGLNPSQLCRSTKTLPISWFKGAQGWECPPLREKNKHHWQPRREWGSEPALGVLSRTASKGRRGPSAPDETVRRGAEGPPWQPVSRYGCRAERQKAGIPRLPLSLRWDLGAWDGLKSEQRAPGPLDHLLDSPAHQASRTVSSNPPPG